MYKLKQQFQTGTRQVIDINMCSANLTGKQSRNGKKIQNHVPTSTFEIIHILTMDLHKILRKFLDIKKNKLVWDVKHFTVER